MMVPSSLQDMLAYVVVRRDHEVTHSLGFFFGPGLPLGFKGSSVPAPSPLFEPVLGLADSFLMTSSLGSGSTFGTDGGTGVLSESGLDSGGGVASLGGAGVDIDRGDFFLGTDFWAIGSCGNRSSDGLGSWRWIIFVGLEDLLTFSVEAGVDVLDTALDDFR